MNDTFQIVADPDELVLSVALETDEHETFLDDAFRTFVPGTKRWAVNPETHRAWGPMLLHDSVLIELGGELVNLTVHHRTNADGTVGTFQRLPRSMTR